MDYRLQGTNGIEASKRILQHNPPIRIVLATADDSLDQQSASAGVYYLRKLSPRPSSLSLSVNCK
jgi:CheY-like chemotaxis protein